MYYKRKYDVCPGEDMIYTQESELSIVEEAIWISKHSLKWEEVSSNGKVFEYDDDNAELISTGCVLKNKCMFVRTKR